MLGAYDVRNPMLRLLRPHLIYVLALCAVVILLAGCGAPDKAEYMAEMHATLKQMDSTGGNPSSMGSAPTESEIRKQQRAFKAAAHRIDDITPPDDIAAAHRRYVAALEACAIDLGKLATAIRDSDGDPNRLAESISVIQQDMEEDVTRLGDVAETFRESGYSKAIVSTG